jgi:hypothetical protein
LQRGAGVSVVSLSLFDGRCEAVAAGLAQEQRREQLKESSGTPRCVACVCVWCAPEKGREWGVRTDRTYLSMAFAAFAKRVVVLVCGAHQDSMQGGGLVSY